MKTFLKSLLRPQLLETVNSRFNGELKVYQSGRTIYVSTGHLTQTGGLIKDLWNSTLKKIGPRHNANWLVLGLAGGTVANIIAKKYHSNSITGVEIDKQMLALGKKYLDLDKIPHLTIINSDAQNYLKHLKTKFDYILVDMYIGDKLPDFVYSNHFLSHLSHLGDLVILNHLFYDEPKKNLAHVLIKSLESRFHHVVLHRTLTNLMIILPNQYNQVSC
jgi:spermidine synthase